MSLRTWLQNVRSALKSDRGRRHHQRRCSPRAAPHRPTLEILEDRCVPASSVWADFNGDALLDLATANSLSGEVSIVLGNDDGTSQPAQNYAVAGYPNCIVAGDVNNDGNLDLVTGNVSAYEPELSVLVGNGDGSFQWIGNSVWLTGTEGNSAADITAADFDTDGNLDVAVVFAPPGSAAGGTVH